MYVPDWTAFISSSNSLSEIFFGVAPSHLLRIIPRILSGEAFLTADQGYTDNTETKVQFNSVQFDTASAWDGTNYWWVVPSAGKYFIR